MRSIEEVQAVLGLLKKGHNHSEIARRTRIPRRTIIDWSQGKIPRSAATGNRSCPSCGWPAHDFNALAAPPYSYLLGLYLGDGHIAAARKGVFALRICLDRHYPRMIAECAESMATVMPLNKVAIHPAGDCQMDRVQCYSKQWPCLFPQHGPGRKHDRPIRLTAWQKAITHRHPRPLLRGLIHSDGYRGINTIKHPHRTYSYPRYQFCNRSDDIRQIFCDHCDILGVEWRVMNRWNISVARRESVARLDEFIGPKR